VDAYQTWALFLIFISIVTLISGVVLLTLKKPESNNSTLPAPTGLDPARSPRDRSSSIDNKSGDLETDDEGENSALSGRRRDTDRPTDETFWQVGDLSDDEDHENEHRDKTSLRGGDSVLSLGKIQLQSQFGEEGVGLMHEHDLDGEHDHDSGLQRLPDHRRSSSSDATLAVVGSTSRTRISEEFKDWDT
jgi:magnesium transporter